MPPLYSIPLVARTICTVAQQSSPLRVGAPEQADANQATPGGTMRANS
jgi:hypothetical protein